MVQQKDPTLTEAASVEPQPVTDRVTARRSLGDPPLRQFFEAAIKYRSSDLLLRGGAVPVLRLRGDLKALDHPPLDAEALERAIHGSVSESQWRTYRTRGSLDLAVSIQHADGHSHRFRVNVFRTQGLSAIAARRIDNRVQRFEQLYLPPVLAEVTRCRHGLVLLAGATSSGKSTTIASMLQQINETRPCHILTIEDPIEYLFTEVKALINQREVGVDVPSYAEGLRAMMRENPDVVLIGEMRDRETFEAALQASETGHLVYGTIHASSATQVFGRIYDLFSAEERSSLRNVLAHQLQAVICQKLVPTIREDPPVVPAVEVLLQTPAVRAYILQGREHDLNQVIESERQAGMQRFTDSLVELVRQQFISPQAAREAATQPEELRMRLSGIVAN